MIRVGVIGASWGAQAHIPAIQALPGMSVTAIGTAHMATARTAAEAFGIPHAFDDPSALAQHPEVDLVAVAVRVPEHARLVRAALAAGKDIYCEWPLGIDTREAEALLAEAEAAGVRHVVGLQSRAAPVVEHVRMLVEAGHIGELIGTTMIHSGPWRVEWPSNMAYLNLAESGANMLTIRAGHSLDAMTHALGPFSEVSASFATLYETIKLIDTGGTMRRTSPDQVVVNGRLASGALAALHVAGSPGQGVGFRWEIAGSKGDLVVAGASGTRGIQMSAELTVQEVGPDGDLRTLPTPPEAVACPMAVGPALNVAQVYARFRDGLPTPSFADAVEHHRLLDAISLAAKEGRQVAVG